MNLSSSLLYLITAGLVLVYTALITDGPKQSDAGENILTVYLLNASAKGLAHLNCLRDLVEVSVTSNKEVKGQGQLCESASRHALNERLIVDFEETVSSSP